MFAAPGYSRGDVRTMVRTNAGAFVERPTPAREPAAPRKAAVVPKATIRSPQGVYRSVCFSSLAGETEHEPARK